MIFWPSLAVALFLLSMPMWWKPEMSDEDYAWWIIWLTIALVGVATGALYG